jgi:HAD superfamily hydrolase (TIGR01509 family)
MPSAILFDLFNTLVELPRDSRPYVRLCRSVGCVDRLRESLVVDAPRLADFCDHRNVPHPEELPGLQRALESDIAASVLFSDVAPALRALRSQGVRIALISNLASPYKRAFHQHGLAALIDAQLFSCDAGLAKPDPRIYRLALERLGVEPSQAVMVGDSQRSDVDGPTKCGIRAFLLERAGRSSAEGSLRSLSQLSSRVPS